MEKHEMVYRTYQRNHKYDNSLEMEEKKIVHEKKVVEKKQKQINKKMNQIISGDMNDEEFDDLDSLMYAEDKTKKNSHTHKVRLNELKKNKDFK